MKTLFGEIDVCESRHGGNAESVDAFAMVQPVIREKHQQILALLANAWPGGLTAKEVAASLGTRLNCISGRLSELKAEGAVFQLRGEDGKGLRREGSAVLAVRKL